MNNRYQDLLEKLEPYIVTSPYNMEHFSQEFMGKEILKDLIFNPLSLESSDFINHIYKMDDLTFGGQGMGMDKWVFFDCSIMPGACFGFAIKAKEIPSEERLLFNITSEDEYVPLSMYIAIPNADQKSWFGHNLSSLNGKVGLDLSGLGLLTKYCAMKVLNIDELVGATQWGSAALGIHTQISDLYLESAITPSHTYYHSLCYRSKIGKVEDVLFGGPRKAFQFTRELSIHPDEIKQSYSELESLQELIEQGQKIYITGRPKFSGNKVCYFLRIEE